MWERRARDVPAISRLQATQLFQAGALCGWSADFLLCDERRRYVGLLLLSRLLRLFQRQNLVRFVSHDTPPQEVRQVW